MFEALPRHAAANPNVERLGRSCTAEFALVADGTPWHVRVKNGRIASVEEGPFKMRGTAFRIEASAEAWEEFRKPYPPPGFHDIFAMSATGNARIEGDMGVLLQHLAFFKALIACLRERN